ncbi:MAG TPA: hypothetical protein VGN26_12425 [Armatimonadota bacterium]
MATSTQRLIDAVKTRLEADLPARLTAAGLPAISEVLTYQPGLLNAAKAPQVWLDMPQAKRSEAPGRGASQGYFVRNRTLLVGITGAGSEAAVAASNLRQTADLVRQCLEAEQYATEAVPLGGEALWVRWLEDDYTPNESSTTALLQMATLVFDVPCRVGRGEE